MDLVAQIRLALQSTHHPIPSPQWLASLLSSRSPPPPLPSLIATAKARLLTADLTTPSLLDPSRATSFPADVSSTDVAERVLSSDVYVQVLDIENLSRSRWEQVEELEALERGEGTRGREIIRLPNGAAPEDADDEDALDLGDGESQAPNGGQVSSRVSSGARGAPVAGAGAGAGNANSGSSTAAAAAGKNATHRLVLQDCKGQSVYAMELKRIDQIGLGKTAIGEKFMLRKGTVVARGTVLLEPGNCVVLGGRIEAWQKPWVEGRLKRLREAVGEERPG